MIQKAEPILSGCTVLELAGVLAGPSVGMFLAELGARIIKIENPATDGDVTRSWKLPTEPKQDKQSSYFNSINWGKESLFLDLKSSSGRNTLFNLIEDCDIILTSYKPGDAGKLGLTYEDCKQWKPDIIYASITGYGEDDHRTAYDALIQAESGFMHLNREPDGQPLKMPVAMMDILTAHHLKELILIAWIQRLKSGEGALVETSLFEAAVSSLTNQAGAWLYAGTDPEPMGSEHPHIYPYGCSFNTADGRSIILAVGNDTQFNHLCDILDISHLSFDNRFATNQSRSVNRDELRSHLEDAFSKQHRASILIKKLHAKRVPAGVIRTVKEAIESYQNRFPIHQDEHDTSKIGIPNLAGSINSQRASKKLSGVIVHDNNS